MEGSGVSFESDMKKIQKRFDKGLANATAATLLAVTTQVIKGTPVDTGRAKANWQASINRPANGTVDSTDRSARGGKTVQAAIPVINQAVGKVYHLTNNVPYIGLLEFVPNYTKKTETGWVRKSVKNFNKILAKNLKAEFRGN